MTTKYISVRGRRTKLTPARQEAICKALRGGSTREIASRYAEIDPATFWRWFSANTSFRGAVEKAEADCDAALLGRIRASASAGDWKAGAWLLERHPRTRAEFRQNAEVTVVGPDGAAPTVEVKHTHGLAIGTAAALDQLAQLAGTLDVMVRVGLVPPPGGTSGAGLKVVGAGDSEDDEVHPA